MLKNKLVLFSWYFYVSFLNRWPKRFFPNSVFWNCKAESFCNGTRIRTTSTRIPWPPRRSISRAKMSSECVCIWNQTMQNKKYWKMINSWNGQKLQYSEHFINETDLCWGSYLRKGTLHYCPRLGPWSDLKNYLDSLIQKAM